MRASAQTLSYEVFLRLSLMGVVTGRFIQHDRHRQQPGASVLERHPAFFWFITFAIALPGRGGVYKSPV